MQSTTTAEAFKRDARLSGDLDASHLLSGSYRDVAYVIGWEKALVLGRAVWQERRSPSRLVSDKGRGGTIYIPKSVNERVGAALLKYLSVEDAKSLVERFGGEHLEFGIPWQNRSGRDDAIAQNVQDGWPLQHVAWLFDLNVRTVWKICKDRGVISKDLRRTVKALKSERREGVRLAVLQAFEAGGCICSAAYNWGFAPDVADAIVRESGVSAINELGASAPAPNNAPISFHAPHGLRASLCPSHG